MMLMKNRFIPRYVLLLFVFIFTTVLDHPANSSEIFQTNLKKICEKNQKKCLHILIRRLELEAASKNSNLSTTTILINTYAEFFLHKGKFEKLATVVELVKKYTGALLNSSPGVNLDAIDFFIRFISHFSGPKQFNDWATTIKNSMASDIQKKAYIKYLLPLIFENNSDDKLTKNILEDPNWKNALADPSPRIIWQKIRFQSPKNSTPPPEIENIQPPIFRILYSGLYYKLYAKDMISAVSQLEKGLEILEKEIHPKKGLIFEYQLELAKVYKSQGKIDKSLTTLDKIEKSQKTLDEYLLNYRVSFFECYISSYTNNLKKLSCDDLIKLSPNQDEISIKIQLYSTLTKRMLAEKKPPDLHYLKNYKNTWLFKDFM